MAQRNYIDPSNPSLIIGDVAGGIQQSLTPSGSQTVFPVNVAGLAPYTFNVTTVGAVGGVSTLVSLGRIEALVHPTGQTVTLPGHLVAHLAWTVGQGTGGLLIGGEGKVDILSTGNYTQVVLGDMNLNQIVAGATVGSVFGGLVQEQNIGVNLSTLIGYGMTIANAPQAGVTVTLFAGLYETPPAAVLGTITIYAGLYHSSWAAVPGIANITVKYTSLDQDPSFMLDQAGPVYLRSSVNVPGVQLLNYASDAAAATGGVQLGQLYHNAGAVRVRIV